MKGSALVEAMPPVALSVLRGHLRVDAGAGPRPVRGPGRHRRLPGPERRVRQVDHRLLGAVRRPERAGLQGVRHRGPIRAAGGRRASEFRRRPQPRGRGIRYGHPLEITGRHSLRHPGASRLSSRLRSALPGCHLLLRACPPRRFAVRIPGLASGPALAAVLPAPDCPLFRPDISPVGADCASVMRCHRSLLLVVGRCCCRHRRCWSGSQRGFRSGSTPGTGSWSLLSPWRYAGSRIVLLPYPDPSPVLMLRA